MLLTNQTLHNAKDAIILGLAVCRVSHMVAWEDGILGLNAELRKLAGVISYTKKDAEFTVPTKVAIAKDIKTKEVLEYTIRELPVEYSAEPPPHLQPTLLAKGFKCTWCISFWFSIFTWLMYKRYPKHTVAVAKPLALNVLAIIFNKVMS